MATSVGFLKTLTSACTLHDAAPNCSVHDLRTHRLPCVSCHQKDKGGDELSHLLLDRRDMLVALGGLYGAAGQMALANPVMPPNKSSGSAYKVAMEKNIATLCCANSNLHSCRSPYQGTIGE